MRVNQGPLSYDEAREIFESSLDHYLAGGDLLPTCNGLSDATDGALARVAGAVFEGRDPSPEVAAAWAAFDALHSAPS